MYVLHTLVICILLPFTRERKKRKSRKFFSSDKTGRLLCSPTEWRNWYIPELVDIWNLKFTRSFAGYGHCSKVVSTGKKPISSISSMGIVCRPWCDGCAGHVAAIDRQSQPNISGAREHIELLIHEVDIYESQSPVLEHRLDIVIDNTE